MRSLHASVLAVLLVALGCGPAPAPSEPSLEQRIAELRELEYHASPTERGLQAPNRQHGLRSFFDARGVHVEDRIAGEHEPLAALSLSGVGRASELAAVPPGEVTAQGTRVEIRREGLVEWFVNSPLGLEHGFELAERPAGEGELVFELALDGARAFRHGPGLELATDRGRRLRYDRLHVFDAERRELDARLELASERRIEIRVADAGAVYPIVVDPILSGVADATLNPEPGFPQYAAAAGASVAFVGDVDGDGFGDVAVGAPFFSHPDVYEGAVAIFYGAPGGFRTVFTLLDSNQAEANLGASVAGAGDVNGDGFDDVIVGAPRYDAGQDDEGAAFIFHGSASGIAGTVPDGFDRLVGSVALAATRIESNQIGALMAESSSSVAGVGDVNGDGFGDVVVGDPRWEDSFPAQADEGAAFVFLGSASGVANGNPGNASATLQSNTQFAQMGFAVSGAGDIDADGYADLVVGTPNTLGVGTACIQYGGPAGIASATSATCTTRLTQSFTGSFLGWDVAGIGDLNGDGFADVAIGAPGYASVVSGEGAVFVWRGRATRIPPGNESTASDSIIGQVSSSSFGSSVSGAGDVNGDAYADLIVGAELYNYAGAAFVFAGGPFGLGTNLVPENVAYTTLYPVIDTGADQAYFGTVVGAGGDANGDGFGDLVVGAPNQDYADMPVGDRGKSTVYFGGGEAVRTTNPFTALEFVATPGPIESAQRFGYDVAPAGDVNGDGRADLAVAAFGFDAGEAGEGAAFVFTGGSTHSAMFQTDQIAAQVNSVHAAGDVNGDGYGDLIVGSASYDSGQTNEGVAFVLLGSAAGITSTNPTNAHGRLDPNRNDAAFGTDVASAGDVNGDGFADVVVASALDGLSQSQEGIAFVFHGSAAGIPNRNAALAETRFETNQGGAGLDSVAGAGDVNGDGYSDVLVGSPRYTDTPATEAQEGAVFVLLGGPNGLANGEGINGPADAQARLESDQANAHLGAALAFAGDVNGDGYDDVIAGAPQYVRNGMASGAAFVFHGGAAGVVGTDPGTAARVLAPGVEPAQFGASVGGRVDLNGDGFGDVIVGAPGVEINGLFGAGAAFVYLGGASGVVGDDFGNGATQLSRGAESFEAFGASVQGIGDYNGDGFGDLAVGIPDTTVSFPAFFSAVGEVRIYDGSRLASVFPGKTVRAHQLRSALDRTVQPVGAIGAPTGFRVRADASGWQGRARIKLEVEACPVSAPFGAGSCVHSISPSWTEVGPAATSVTFTQSVVGLPLATAYRWRARTLHAPFRVTQAGITPPPRPSHGPWRRLHGGASGWDLRNEDVDGDGVVDRSDNCPSVANADQADGDADLVGNVCDNCTTTANARVVATFLGANPWATLTGHQRDDDHDGYGNRCDAKFPGVAGTVVNANDLVQFRASNGKNRTADTCGTTGLRPCAIFDLDEGSTVIGAGDLSRFRQLNGKTVGPKCATCPLTCEAGTSGTCGAIP